MSYEIKIRKSRQFLAMRLILLDYPVLFKTMSILSWNLSPAHHFFVCSNYKKLKKNRIILEPIFFEIVAGQNITKFEKVIGSHFLKKQKQLDLGFFT